MPALPSSVIEPLWDQFAALLPERVVTHPLGCHRPRIPDRVVFDKLVQTLVLGASNERVADTTCSATTIRDRRDEWIEAGVFAQLEQLCLEAYDRIVGLDLDDVCVDGCIVKAPCGGEAAGKSPVDRGKQGTKRSLLIDGAGIPLGCVAAPANCHDSPLLRPTLETLGRFEKHHGIGFGVGLPDKITVHLDAGIVGRRILSCSEGQSRYGDATTARDLGERRRLTVDPTIPSDHPTHTVTCDTCGVIAVLPDRSAADRLARPHETNGLGGHTCDVWPPAGHVTPADPAVTTLTAPDPDAADATPEDVEPTDPWEAAAMRAAVTLGLRAVLVDMDGVLDAREQVTRARAILTEHFPADTD